MDGINLTGTKFINRLLATNLRKDLLWMILFGALSFLFGLVRFYIPGTEGTISDLREIPLFISIFHLSNPLFVIGTSAIASLGTPAEGSYLSSFLLHIVALLISWVIINYLKKQKIPILLKGIICLFYVFVYYLLLLLPLLIYTNYLVKINLDKNFSTFYIQLFNGARYEIISTALITTLYFIQQSYRETLNLHMDNLENTVKVRTSELNSVIDELKATQQYLVQKEKMASLGTLSAGIAHEINNPLNFISGGLHIFSEIKDEIGSIAPAGLKSRCETSYEIIYEGLNRSMNIVKALNTFSVRGPSNLMKSNVHEIIENTLLFLNYRLPPEIIVNKDFKLDTDIPLYVDKMHQVIINILDNAIFEFKSEAKANPVITITTRQTAESAILTISNNGRSIPEGILDQIFDPFFTTKDPGQGVGLGLSICYALIQAHSGKIHARNSDSGVSFIIELPLK